MNADLQLLFNINFFKLFPDLSLISILMYIPHPQSYSACYKWQSFRIDSVLNKIIIECANLSILGRIQVSIVCNDKRSNHEHGHCRVDYQKRTVRATQYQGKTADFAVITSCVSPGLVTHWSRDFEFLPHETELIIL